MSGPLVTTTLTAASKYEYYEGPPASWRLASDAPAASESLEEQSSSSSLLGVKPPPTWRASETMGIWTASEEPKVPTPPMTPIASQRALVGATAAALKPLHSRSSGLAGTEERRCDRCRLLLVTRLRSCLSHPRCHAVCRCFPRVLSALGLLASILFGLEGLLMTAYGARDFWSFLFWVSNLVLYESIGALVFLSELRVLLPWFLTKYQEKVGLANRRALALVHLWLGSYAMAGTALGEAAGILALMVGFGGILFGCVEDTRAIEGAALDPLLRHNEGAGGQLNDRQFHIDAWMELAARRGVDGVPRFGLQRRIQTE